MKMLMTCAALALVLDLVAAPALAHGGWATWKCTADGIRYSPTAPVPQRVPFTRSGPQRVAAVAAAMDACRASSKVKPGSCRLETCWAA